MSSLRKVFNLRNAAVFAVGLTAGVAISRRPSPWNNCRLHHDQNVADRLENKWGWGNRFGKLPCRPKWNDNWDKLKKCEGAEGEKVTAERTIILVRHGQYNFDGKSDDLNHHLTSLGEEQATILGRRLKDLKDKFGGFKGLYYSPLKRATQTAQIVSKEMGIDNLNLDPLLKEGIPCTPHPAPQSLDFNISPEEKLQQGKQLEDAFRKYFHRADPQQKENSCEVIVCHANIIRYFVCRALQLPPEAWMRFSLESLDHTSLTTLKIHPNGVVKLIRYADSTHLPDDKRTYILE